MHHWPMSRVFLVDATRYSVAVELAPAIAEAIEKGVAQSKLIPLLRFLDAEFRTSFKRFETRRRQEANARIGYVDEGMRLHKKGMAFRSIGEILAKRGHGNADRIARTLAAMIQPGAVAIAKRKGGGPKK